MFFKMQSKLTGYDWDVRECGKKVSLYMGILFFQLFCRFEIFLSWKTKKETTWWLKIFNHSRKKQKILFVCFNMLSLDSRIMGIPSDKNIYDSTCILPLLTHLGIKSICSECYGLNYISPTFMC